jgi:hypothetical protein
MNKHLIVCLLLQTILACTSKNGEAQNREEFETTISTLAGKDVTDEEILRVLFENSIILYNSNNEYDRFIVTKGFYKKIDGYEREISCFAKWERYNVPFNEDDKTDDRIYPKLIYTARIVDWFSFLRKDIPHIIIKTVINHDQDADCRGCSSKVRYSVLEQNRSGLWQIVDQLDTYESSWGNVLHEVLKISTHHVAILNEHHLMDCTSLSIIALIDNKLQEILLIDANEDNSMHELPEDPICINESNDGFCDDENPDLPPCFRYKGKYSLIKDENSSYEFYNLIVSRREEIRGKTETKIYKFNGKNYIFAESNAY